MPKGRILQHGHEVCRRAISKDYHFAQAFLIYPWAQGSRGELVMELEYQPLWFAYQIKNKPWGWRLVIGLRSESCTALSISSSFPTVFSSLQTTLSSAPHRISVLKVWIYLLPLISWLGLHTWSPLMKLAEQSQSTFSMLAGTGGRTLASDYPCMHARR